MALSNLVVDMMSLPCYVVLECIRGALRCKMLWTTVLIIICNVATVYCQGTGFKVPVTALIAIPVVMLLFCICTCFAYSIKRQLGRTQTTVIRPAITKTDAQIIPDDKPPSYEELFERGTQNGVTNVSFESETDRQQQR
ncbi:hypothetical protein C0J52_09122 [Blattella germanica]|nr:hypothetical protein C0J52_09122 [Blattella germanica]